MKPEYVKLFEAIHDVVNNVEGPWKTIRDEIMAAADESDKSALLEFVAWFEESEEENKNEE